MKNSREVSYFPWGVSDASSCHDGKLDKRMKKTKNLTFFDKVQCLRGQKKLHCKTSFIADDTRDKALRVHSGMTCQREIFCTRGIFCRWHKRAVKI